MSAKPAFKLAASLIAWLYLQLPCAAAGTEILGAFPAKIDPAAKYLIYMHGRNLELEAAGKKPPGPDFDFDGITAALAALGYIVIAEQRPATAAIPAYAKRVADQVGQLLSAGVAAEDIVLAGYSKGGLLVLIGAGMVSNDGLTVVVMAACASAGTPFTPAYNSFLLRLAKQLKGRLLSIVDDADDKAESCNKLFSAAPGINGDEVLTHTGKGHVLFYSVDPAWLEPLEEWLKP